MPDANGKFEVADTGLVGTDRGRLRQKVGGRSEFAARSSDPSLMALELSSGGRVEMALDGAVDVPVDSSEAAEGKVRFPGVRPNADLELTAALWGFKEDIVLRSVNAPTVWDFTVKLSAGLRVEVDTASGAAYVLDAKSVRVAVIPPGFMVDSAIDPRSGEGARSNAVRYTVTASGGVTKLRVTLDTAWLTDPVRKFPVYVDPSLRDNVDADDTYVMSNTSPGVSAWETELKAGTWDGGGHIARSYLHFNEALATLRNTQIFGVALSVHEIYSYCCPAQARDLEVYRVTAPWGAEVDRWPGPAWEGARLGATSASYGNTPGWITIGIPADRMTKWVHSLESFHGFMLSASYTDSYGWKRMSSAQSPQPSNVPFLDVNYSVQGASYAMTNGGFSTVPTAISDGVLPMSVTNWGQTTWPAGAPSTYILRQSIYNSSNQEVISTLGGSALATYSQFNVTAATGPHQTARIDVKVPKLPPGTYRTVLGMAQSGALCSAGCYYAPFTDVPKFEAQFTVPNTPPTITAHSPLNNATVDSLRPTLWVQFVDPDATANGVPLYNYTACGGTPAAPVNCVSSGWQDRSTWQVPSGPLSWSKSSHWTVKLSDGGAESGAIGPFYMTPVVPQPAITSRIVGATDGKDAPGVNPQAGNFGDSVIDAKVSVPGPPLTINRTYNSQDSRTAGAFGAGWTTSFDQRLAEDGDGSGNAVVTLVTGLQVRFGKNPDGAYAPPPGVNLALVRGVNQWTLRDPTGTKRLFDQLGRLTQITDASGNSQTFLYSGSSTQVDKVRDDKSGRQLHLSWANGHVATIATDAPSPGTPAPMWSYYYLGDRLTKVCAPLEADSCTTYDYVASSHHRSVVVDDNPVAHWTLGEATGTVARNLVAGSPGQADASYRGVVQGQQGAMSGSTDFGATFTGGATDGIIGPTDLINKSQSYAAEVWFKAESGKTGVLVSEQNTDMLTAPTSYIPILYIGATGKLRGSAWAPSTTLSQMQVVTPNRVDDGQWHHAVFTVSVNTYTLYLDGVSVGQVTGPVIDHHVSNRIIVGNGKLHLWPDDPAVDSFTGSIDEVSIYKHPLGAEKVASHYGARNTTHRLSKVVEPGNVSTTSVTYDGQGGRVASVTDRHGATWTVGQPVVGDKSRSVTIGSTVRGDVTYVYDTENGGRSKERRDQFGSTKWEYNAAGFVHKTIDPSGWTTYQDTDASGNVIRTARWLGRWSYRGYGYYLNSADPLDPRNDALLWQTNGLGWGDEEYHKTKFTLDAAGRVTQIIYPKPSGATANPTETFAYSDGLPLMHDDSAPVPAGKLIRHTDVRGGVTDYGYWAGNGDLASYVDPVGKRDEYTYDSLGRVTNQTETVRTGSTFTEIGKTAFTYNALSKRTSVTHPPVTDPITNVTHREKVSYTYDRAGRLAESTASDLVGGDAARTTRYGYDGAGRLTSSTAPDQTVVRQEWDAAGDRVKTYDQDNRALEYKYDDRRLLTEVTATGAGVDPLDANSTRLVVDTRAYDPLGRLASIVDAQGRERSFTYHGNGPLNAEYEVVRDQSGAVTSQSQTAGFKYDGAGNVIEKQESDRQRFYVYDDAALLQSEAIDPQRSSRAVTRGHDAGGLVTSVSSHFGQQVTVGELDTMYLSDALTTTSKVDGAGARYADNNTSINYQFAPPEQNNLSGSRNLVAAKITMRLSNQWLVEASTNGTTWTELGRETAAVTDRSNQAERTFDVSGQLSGNNPLRIRVRDARPADGWGGRVTSVRVAFTDAGAPATTTALAYDLAGRQTSATLENPGGTPAALTRTMVRDPRGLVTSMTDETGAVTEATFDALGRLSTSTQAAVETWVGGVQQTGVRPKATLGYNTYGETTATRDANGAVSKVELDTMGRMVRATAPTYTPPGGTALNPQQTVAYDARGLVSSRTDALGGVTRFEYDYYGRPTKVTAPDPDGTGPLTAPARTAGYDRVGQVLRTTDPIGATTEATYDTRGNQATQTLTERLQGQTAYFTSTFAYDTHGRRTKSTSPSGLVTTWEYSTSGEVIGTKSPSGVTSYFDYDHSGRLEGTITNATHITAYTHDAAGRLTGESDHVGTWNAPGPALRTRSHTYDAAGRPTQETSPEGRISRYGYDTIGRTTSVTQFVNPNDQSTATAVQLRYDAAGNRTRMVDGNGNATDYTYNTWGLQESVVEPSTPQHTTPSSRTWTTSYDIGGRAIKDSLPGGVTINRTFDGLGRLTQATGAGTAASTTAKSFAYDAAGRPTQFSAPGGNTTLVWNDRSLITSASGPTGDSTFDYDAESRLATRVDQTGTTGFGYNATTGQLASIAEPLTGRSLGLGYDTQGRLSSVGYGSAGAQRTFTYDDLNRVARDQLAKPDGTVTSATDYTYDRDNLITGETVTGLTGSGGNTYTHDGLGRLTSWRLPNGDLANYGWDAASNRVTMTTPQGTRTATYDARNRLVAETGGVTNNYSARGTLQSTTTPAGTVTYQHDAFERLASATKSGQTATYEYDALDRLAKRNGISFGYAGTSQMPIATPGAGGTSLISRALSGAPLADRTGAGTTRSLLTDVGHGDVTAAFDPATGLPAASTTFAPFGEPTSTGDKPTAGFQGGYTDPLTGQVHAQSRWYDPATGVFTSRDTWTLAPSPTVRANRYTYADGAPETYNDPSGHIVPLLIGAAIGGIAMYMLHRDQESAPGPDVIQPCSSRPCGYDSSHQNHRQQERDFANSQGSSGSSNGGGKANSGVNGSSKGNGKGSVGGNNGRGTKVVPPTPPPPPIAEQNNKYPSPRPTTEQTLGPNRPQPGGPGSSPPVVIPSIGGSAPVYYTPNEATSAECSVQCQALGGIDVLLTGIGTILSGTAGLVVNLAECFAPWILIDDAPCGENIQAIVSVVQYAASNPLGFVGAIWDGLTKEAFDAFDQGRYGEGLAHLVVNFGDLLIGSHGITAVEKFGDLPTCKRPNSFTGDTEVLMADGSRKRIARIRPGDKVIATDPETGERSVREVTSTRKAPAPTTLVRLSVATETGAEVVTATEGHPIWVVGHGGWLRAARVTSGDRLLTADGAAAAVTATARVAGSGEVHNLTVADVHTYHVVTAETAAVVHNCDGGGPDGIDDDMYDVLDDEFGPQVADGVDYNVQAMHGTDKARATSHTIPGVGHDPVALANYFNGFTNIPFTHVDTKIEEGASQAFALYDAERGVAIIRNTRMIHGYTMSLDDFIRRFQPVG